MSRRKQDWARREARRRISSSGYNTSGMTEAMLYSQLLTANDNPYSSDSDSGSSSSDYGSSSSDSGSSSSYDSGSSSSYESSSSSYDSGGSFDSGSSF